MLPIADDLVVGKSIEIYGDAEPCFIHRSAVLRLIYLEIDDFMQNAILGGRTTLKYSDMPAILQKIVKSIYSTSENVILNISI